MHSPKRPQKCEAGTLGNTGMKGEEEVKKGQEWRPGRALKAGRKVGAIDTPQGIPRPWRRGGKIIKEGIFYKCG